MHIPMKRLLPLIAWCLCLAGLPPASAQSVGLVLSGGGAKGMAHIGVIKALEENGIPIDYVAGTSMGAIVGGMYAIGMTPEEMVALLKSDDFKRWSTGEVEQRYIYYYKNADPSPSVFNLRFHVDASHGIDSFAIRPVLPTNMISSVQMNYAFVELFMQANAAAEGDFDRLFIPFRCVASDIYKKEAVVFRQGDLGDAIRASMTFPFVFKPIEVDNNLLFDGGIFNNFPVDVMQEDFHPGFVVGSVVASEQRKPSADNVYEQLQTMIMGHTDYSIPEDEGILLRFDLDDQPLFDFAKVDELVQLGYEQTLARMDEIKSRVTRRLPADELDARRGAFKARMPEARFKDILLTGIDSLQQQYVSKVFRNQGDTFGLKQLKDAYFELVSDEMIHEIVPHGVYNPRQGLFDLHLDVQTEVPFKVQVGGNISSTTSNQGFVGLQYQNIREYAQTAYIGGQFGKIYNGLNLGTRIDIPSRRNLYMKADVVLHKYDFYENNRFFYQAGRVSDVTQNELYAKIRVGLPLTLKGRAEFGLGFGLLNDHYVQDRELLTETSVPDRSTYAVGSVFAQADSYTLDNVMYPTAGHRIEASLQGLYGVESYRSVDFPSRSMSGKRDWWLQLKGRYEQYFPIVPRFVLGAHAELAFSTRDFAHNYTATLIQLPAFTPTPHSRTVFNPSFRADRFAAAGVKPIFKITDALHLRNETYAFVPYRTIYRRPDNSAAYSVPFTEWQYLSETSLVLNLFDVASVSLFVNYYSDGTSPWNFGINIGCLLFNDRFLK